MGNLLQDQTSSFFPKLRLPFFLFDEQRDIPSFSSSSVEIAEDEDHVMVRAPLPGLKKEEIEASFQQGVLWIRGKHKEENRDKKKKYYQETVKNFAYQVTLPSEVEEDGSIEAEYIDGMLQVSFCKARKKEAKKIEIKESSGSSDDSSQREEQKEERVTV